LFDDFEATSYLCKRFTSFVMKYNLMSRDNLIVPNMEEGSLETGSVVTAEVTAAVSPSPPGSTNSAESEA
jgi:hypothetical protein